MIRVVGACNGLDTYLAACRFEQRYCLCGGSAVSHRAELVGAIGNNVHRHFNVVDCPAKELRQILRNSESGTAYAELVPADGR